MKSVLIFAVPLLLVGSGVPAKSRQATVKWMDGPPGLPSGAKFAVTSGDPSKEGEFTIRAKLPANYSVPPHHHPTDEKVSVLSGGPLSYGMGDKLDRASATALNKGYHVTLGAGMNHWVFNSDPVEIQIKAMGPFAITYANPKEDPRTK